MTKNLTVLPLPLHCYDEAGRVRPPLWIHWLCFWGCRSLFILASVFMLGERGQSLPSLIYDTTQQWIIACGFGLLYFCIWLIIGRREWFWRKNISLRWLKSSVILIMVADVIMQLFFIVKSGAAFSLTKGLFLLITCLFLVCVFRSKHVKLMIKDWH